MRALQCVWEVVPLQGPILAAIDLNPATDDVLRQASAIAASLQARLFVCHILPETVRVRMLFPQLAVPDVSVRADFERKAHVAVSARVEAVTRRTIDGFQILLDAGSPHGGILAQAESVGAGAIVVGPGSAAHRVARHATCPVLIARPSPRGCVLGATDFSDASLPAIEMAVAEAVRRGTALRVIHSLEITETLAVVSPHVGILPAIPADVIQELEQEALDRLRASLARFGAKGECLVARAGAISAIIQAAREIPTELVVVGTRGRTRLPRLLLGSVAEAVMQNSPCSVLVIHLAR